MRVPFIDLKGQVQDCGEKLHDVVIETLDSCGYVLGPRGKALEETIAQQTGVAHGVGISSGTDALILGLQALGLEKGGRVGVPAFTFAASVSSILFAGGKPRFIDVEEGSFNIDIEKALDADVDGYIPVHLYGNPVSLDEFVTSAHAKGRFVLEDCAQAFGASSNGALVGSQGDAAVFSFYPTKNLSAAGDAGMLVTDDSDVAEKCRLLRNHGEAVRYHHSILGRNCRLDEIQAAVLLTKLEHVDEWNRMRRVTASKYDESLSGVGDIITPEVPADGTHVYNLYTIRTSRRDDLREFLQAKDIGAGIYYPVGMHLQPVFSEFVGNGEVFPITEKLCAEVLSIPMFPHISGEQVEYVIESIREFFG